MSVVADRFPDALTDGGGRARAALAAVCIAVGGFVAGLLGLLLVRPAFVVLGVGETAAVQVISGQFIQVGFAAFAGAYLFRHRDWDRYVKVRWPTTEDVAWLFVIPVGFLAIGFVVSPLLAALGLPDPHVGSGGEQIDLSARPLLWPVAFAWMYLFAAPAEELVYRGLVQGRLRVAFDTAGVVLLGGVAFGLMHFLVGLVTPDVGLAGSVHWGVTTGVPGLLWGYVYERTENLAVTATSHAMTWTALPYEAVVDALPV